MRPSSAKKQTSQRGQAMSEYGIGIAIIAVAIIVSLSIVSGATGAVFSTISSSIGNVTGPAPSGGPVPSPTATPVPGAFAAALERHGTNIQGALNDEGYTTWYVNFSGGTAPYAYSGFVDQGSPTESPVGESGLSAGPTDGVPSGAASVHFTCVPGTNSHTITITATDAAAGSIPLTDTMTFTCSPMVMDSFNVTPGSYTPGAATWNHSFSAAASGGDGPYTYSWVDSIGQVATGTVGSVDLACGHLNIGPYLSVSVTDINGNNTGQQAPLSECASPPGAGGPASLTYSTVLASPDQITPDGSSTITVRLLDADGNQLGASGGTITLINDVGATFSAVTDHNNGIYTATMTDNTNELVDCAGSCNFYANINAKLDGTQLDAAASVNIRTPDNTLLLDTVSGAAGAFGTLNNGSTVTINTFSAPNPMPADWLSQLTTTGVVNGGQGDSVTYRYYANGVEFLPAHTITNAAAYADVSSDWHAEFGIGSTLAAVPDGATITITLTNNPTVPGPGVCGCSTNWYTAGAILDVFHSSNAGSLALNGQSQDSSPSSGTASLGDGEVTIFSYAAPTTPSTNWRATWTNGGIVFSPGSPTCFTLRYRINGVLIYGGNSSCSYANHHYSRATHEWPTVPLLHTGDTLSVTIEVDSGTSVTYQAPSSIFTVWSSN